MYIFSGPYGVGKSTIANMLALELEGIAVIEGDLIKSIFRGKDIPVREKRRAIIWETITSTAKNLIENDCNVIIDYVLEDEQEYEWLFKSLSNLNVEIFYVVLRAEQEQLIERLTKRGHEYLITYSLALLDTLENLPPNKSRLYDTTNKEPEEIINDLKDRFEHFSIMDPP